MDCTYLASGISTNLDDTTHSTTFAEASVGRTALLDAEAVSACLESGHFDEKSTGAPLSIAYSDGCLVMDTLAKNPCRDENFSSLTRALEFDSGSKGSLDDLLTVSVSAGACLDSPMLDLSDPLCKSGPVCSAPSEGPNVANEPGNLPSKTGRTNVQTEKTVCIRLYFLKFSEV
jgi:hypothetical protein